MLRAAFGRDRLKPGKDEKTAKRSGQFTLRNDDVEKAGSDEEYAAINVQFRKQTTHDEEDGHDNYESAQSDSSGKEDAISKKHDGSGPRESFSNSERSIYEMQLAQLQEQLVASMIASQEANAELGKLRATNVESLLKDLEDEREKNKALKGKLKQKHKVATSKLHRKPASREHHRGTALTTKHSEDMDWVDLGSDFDDLSRIPSFSARSGDAASTSATQSEYPPLQDIQAVDEGTVITSNQDRPPSKIEVLKERLVTLALDRLWDFVNDGPKPAEEDVEEEQLAVKKLKENISRFTNAIRPITNSVKSVGRLLSWSSPTATFLTLIIYMYAVWHGVLLSLFLLLLIWKLFMNYLYVRGIAKQLGFPEMSITEEPSNFEEHSWSDKFHLVLQVARKVQNTLGKLADSLEKIKNLLMWQHYAAARSLFIRLCMAFVASLVFSGPQLFMMGGLALGFKMFITKPLYTRFPKVKNRYDSTARLWRELPTDADLAAQEEFDMVLARCCTATNGTANNNGTSRDSSFGSVFSDKFNLPSAETPLPDWEDGRRCVLMDKDKPLSHVRHGSLYMSQSYLCFEKVRGKHVVIKLEDIKSLSKAKPIGLMPGTGMALEIHVRGRDKPYVFGAIIRRNEVYENIREAGKAANLPWACG